MNLIENRDPSLNVLLGQIQEHKRLSPKIHHDIKITLLEDKDKDNGAIIINNVSVQRNTYYPEGKNSTELSYRRLQRPISKLAIKNNESKLSYEENFSYKQQSDDKSHKLAKPIFGLSTKKSVNWYKQQLNNKIRRRYRSKQRLRDNEQNRNRNKLCLMQQQCELEKKRGVCTIPYCEYMHLRRIVCGYQLCRYKPTECNFLHFQGQRTIYPHVYELHKKSRCRQRYECYNIFCRSVHPMGTRICFSGVDCINHPDRYTATPCKRNHPPLSRNYEVRMPLKKMMNILSRRDDVRHVSKIN